MSNPGWQFYLDTGIQTQAWRLVQQAVDLLSHLQTSQIPVFIDPNQLATAPFICFPFPWLLHYQTTLHSLKGEEKKSFLVTVNIDWWFSFKKSFSSHNNCHSFYCSYIYAFYVEFLQVYFWDIFLVSLVITIYSPLTFKHNQLLMFYVHWDP